MNISITKKLTTNLLILATTGISQAALTTHTTQASFNTTTAGLGLTLGSYGFNSGTPFTTTTSYDFGLFDVSVDQNNFNAPTAAQFGTSPAEGAGHLAWRTRDDLVSEMTICLDTPTQAYSVLIGDLHDAGPVGGTPPDVTRLQIYIGDSSTGTLFWDSQGSVGFSGTTGSITESVTGNTFTAGDNFHSFVGVTDNMASFSKITLRLTDRVDSGSAVDNITLDAMTAEASVFVPEPSSVLLVGLSGMMLIQRRR